MILRLLFGWMWWKRKVAWGDQRTTKQYKEWKSHHQSEDETEEDRLLLFTLQTNRSPFFADKRKVEMIKFLRECSVKRDRKK